MLGRTSGSYKNHVVVLFFFDVKREHSLTPKLQQNVQIELEWMILSCSKRHCKLLSSLVGISPCLFLSQATFSLPLLKKFICVYAWSLSFGCLSEHHVDVKETPKSVKVQKSSSFSVRRLSMFRFCKFLPVRQATTCSDFFHAFSHFIRSPVYCPYKCEACAYTRNKYGQRTSPNGCKTKMLIFVSTILKQPGAKATRNPSATSIIFVVTILSLTPCLVATCLSEPLCLTRRESWRLRDARSPRHL